jgi:hypothetical protein
MISLPQVARILRNLATLLQRDEPGLAMQASALAQKVELKAESLKRGKS